MQNRWFQCPHGLELLQILPTLIFARMCFNALSGLSCYAPALVLADEPTGNLDSKSSQEIMELLKYSNKKYGQTLIVITHDENIALQADRIIRIADGRIVSDEKTH